MLSSLRRRIYALSATSGTNALRNIALATPSDFVYSNGYIRYKSPNRVAEFFLIGSVTLSQVSGGRQDSNRQLCARLMWETFPRASAFIGAVVGADALYVPSFRNGTNFSTLAYKGELVVQVVIYHAIDVLPRKTSEHRLW